MTKNKLSPHKLSLAVQYASGARRLPAVRSSPLDKSRAATRCGITLRVDAPEGTTEQEISRQGYATNVLTLCMTIARL